MFARRPEAAEDLRAVAARLDMPVVVESWGIAEQGLLADVVVSTVPSGVADRLVGMVPEAPGVLLDVVYDLPADRARRSLAAPGRHRSAGSTSSCTRRPGRSSS